MESAEGSCCGLIETRTSPPGFGFAELSNVTKCGIMAKRDQGREEGPRHDIAVGQAARSVGIPNLLARHGGSEPLPLKTGVSNAQWL